MKLSPTRPCIKQQDTIQHGPLAVLHKPNQTKIILLTLSLEGRNFKSVENFGSMEPLGQVRGGV